MPFNEMQQQIVTALQEGKNTNPAGLTPAVDLKAKSTVDKAQIDNTSSGIHKTGQGFIVKIVSWLYHAIIHLADTFKGDVDEFIHSHVFSDIEHYGMDALNIASNLFMSGMTFSGPTSVEGAEKNRLLGWAKNAGVGILSNIGNIAGEIPSLGQVNGAGQSLMNIASNVGMNMQMNQMAEPTIREHVGKPLEAAAKEEAQSSTLSEEEIRASYTKGEISDAEMSTQLSDLGYPESMHPVIMSNSLNTLNADQVKEMLSSNQISANEAAGLLRKAGYSNDDAVRLINLHANSAITDIDKNIKDLLVQMLSDNKISEGNFQDLLRTMHVDEDAIVKLSKAATSQAVVSAVDKETTNLIKLYQEGNLTRQDTEKSLKDLGLEEEHITSVLDGIEKQILKSNNSDVLVSLNRSFQAGLIDEQKFVSELKTLGTDEEKITELLTAAQKKSASNGGNAKQQDVLNQNMLNLAYAEGHLSKEDFISLSSYIGTDIARVDELASVLSISARASSALLPIDNIEEAVEYSSIDDTEATTFLANYGYSPTQISILLDTWHKKAALNGTSGITSTNSTAPNVGLTTGTNYGSIGVENYANVLHALGFSPDQVNSILGMIYRSLIEAGFVTQNAAISILTAGGIDAQTAREIIG